MSSREIQPGSWVLCVGELVFVPGPKAGCVYRVTARVDFDGGFDVKLEGLETDYWHHTRFVLVSPVLEALLSESEVLLGP